MNNSITNIQSVQLDILRKNITNLIAQSIIGVQPMTSYTGTVFTMEFMVTHEPKYKFSREWYVATYNYNYYHEVFEWCTQHFGPHPSCPDAWSRWVHKYEDQIKFRDAQDYEWFVLRWS